MSKKNKSESTIKAFGGATVIYKAKIEKESIQNINQLSTIDHIPRPLTADDDDAIEYYNLTTDYNSYHARCIRVKTDITIGLGINITKGNSDKFMNRLAVINQYGENFEEVLSRVALDYETTGNGYMEIVKGPSGIILELYFMPAVKMYKRPRGADTAFYFLNSSIGQYVPMKAFDPKDTEPGSSVLHFANYTQASRYYGLPDWRGCIPDIELDYYATLYNKKFFINSGIPDLAIIVEGGAFDKDTQDQVTSFLQSNIKGYLNAHKTLYLPVNDPNVKVRFEKLGLEVPKDASFDQLRSRCRDNIVSGHGVYPRLVGIVTAGQLGGGGEATGQLKTFQEITINPRQSMFEKKITPVFNSMDEGAIEFSFEKMDVSIQEPDSTYYPAMINSGVLTTEKARELLGYEQNMIGDDRIQQEKEAMKAQFNQDPETKLIDTLEKIQKAL